MIIRKAQLPDIPFIEHLRRSESESIGFIPLVRYEMEIDGRRGGDVLLCLENEQPVGFVYATYGTDSAKIQQIAIQQDARRMERASALVGAVNNRALHDGIPEVGCRCAEDLESNSFWHTLGFELAGNRLGKSVYSRGKEKLGKHGRRINVYRRSTGLYVARLV